MTGQTQPDVSSGVGQIMANSFDRQWQDCGDDVLAAVERVGASGWYVLGKEGAAFESALGAWTGVRHVVGVANGMDALEIALRIKGIGRGDKVVTTALSAFPTALSILRCGATPVYVDTDAHGLLDPDAVRTACAEHGAIRAIVPVHLYGHLADMPALERVADACGALLFEDAAQAIGARRDDFGVAENGRMASLSFYPTKNLGVMGDGGALLVHDDDAVRMAKALRNYGQTEKYVHAVFGLNSRLDELHAATLTSVFLPRLEGWMNRRRAIAKRYLAGITAPAVTLMPGPYPDGSCWHLFPVLVTPERREAFMAHLRARGVGAAIHYPILMADQQALDKMNIPVLRMPTPMAARLAASEVSLPIHPYLRDDEVDRVIDAVNAWEG
ncbi:DegT/DnrJ/EryC1/StrS family aminotransferase [Ruegeria sp. R13_0]|uniref:DegT/DnrJ/EryC1/StrS family aminotransferase n=1 Tax=Ruegeria sp. R13_0 TaxID=2821099 RepID=UPI001ADC1C35|nr:DegT/DnrJ/EryC1/StrS family aminotransferase [Ruegeria sp. R13_0]MBO9436771.1 DegT/DnrJ/EryC1/StrS family aminotransferase [Ruegeria sp. R13_0]